MAVFLSSNPPGPDQPVRFDHVIELLAPALGKEKSKELISCSAKSLNYDTEQLTFEQAIEILTALGEQPGIVGVSARFARTRLVVPHGEQTQRESRKRSPAPLDETTVGSCPAAPTLESEELVELLAHSIGTEKSREVVSAALSELGLHAGTLDVHQAQQVLDLTAQSGGIVGVSSRFAKARLIFRFNRK